MEMKMGNKNKITKRQAKTNAIYKMILCAITLCIVMAIMLAIYNGTVPAKLAEYEAEKNMEHTAWLVHYGSYVPPVIVIAVVLTCFYSYGATYEPVITQKRKAIIVGIVFAFTYLVLFTYALLSSPGWNLPAAEGEEEIKTMFENCAGWFFAQLIPFMILLSYHLVRASSEKKELLENE